MDVRKSDRSSLRQAIINPLPKRRGEIEVTQGRMYDPRQMGGLGDWSKPLIEWAGEMAVTVDDAEKMVTAFQEAVRIGREWESRESCVN
jgi:hypothetical protein